jgi:hypothetical protein
MFAVRGGADGSMHEDALAVQELVCRHPAQD